jgi:hypothetical protein
MKIACMLTVWNEIEYIPYKIAFCKQNNLVPYVVDNYSDDGTWEWLQDNKIHSHRLDTNGMFKLRPLQDELIKTLHQMEPKPDWCIYNGCDLFPLAHNNNLHDELVRLDSLGFNMANINNIDVYNTGEGIEDRGVNNVFNTYFYTGKTRNFTMIHKYSKRLHYQGDAVFIRDQVSNTGKINGLQINYGNTKTAEERDGTLARRSKAWENGEHKVHGSHYRVGKSKNWEWSKGELIDIRNTDNYKYVKYLQELVPYEFTG